MPCYHPIHAWKTPSGGITLKIEKGIPDTFLELPCRKCIGCRLDIARQWAIRCVHESQMHRENCFLTLTYNPDHLPNGGTLVKKDLQLFLKRLRDLLFRQNEKKPIRFRYYAVGEYGAKGDRPHYHLLIFGFNFPDRRLFYQDGASALYTSTILQNLWPFGYVTIGDLNFDTACYCARYVQKKYIGDNPDDHYQGRIPEFAIMSKQNGGIGINWFRKYQNDLYNHDHCVMDSRFISRPPAFYDRELKKIDPEKFALLQEKRRQKAKDNPDNTPERRAVLKEIQRKKQEEKKRGLESPMQNRVMSAIKTNKPKILEIKTATKIQWVGGAKPPASPERSETGRRK
nr:MAG: replication initiator protein [Microvirus sp.]